MGATVEQEIAGALATLRRHNLTLADEGTRRKYDHTFADGVCTRCGLYAKLWGGEWCGASPVTFYIDDEILARYP
jgi:hypothetical protein